MNASRKLSLEDRLRHIMLESGFGSIRGLAEGCGLAPATLAKRIQKERETGSAKIDGHTIQRVAKKTGFNVHWIMTGEGSPLVGSEVEAESRPAASDNRDRVDWGREVVEGLVRQGVSPGRARHAVGALLLQHDSDFSSVVELYQASLEKLGMTPGPATAAGASKEASTASKNRGSQSRSQAKRRQK